MHRAAPQRTARWPLAVVCLYAALIPFQPVFVFGDGSPLRFAAADLVAPFILLAAVMHPRRAMPFALAATVAAIPLLAAASTLLSWSARPISTYAIGKTAGLFYLAITALAMVRCTAKHEVPRIVRAIGFGAFWSAVVGLIGYAAYLVGIQTTLVVHDRLCSTMTGDPNIYGGLVAIGLLATVGDRGLRPTTRLIRGSVLLLALIASGSRSAVLGAVTGIVVLTVVRGRDPLTTGLRSAFAVLAASIVAAVLFASGLGTASSERLWGFFWREFTVSNRFELYRQALTEFTEHPVTGLGIGGFREMNQFNHGGSMMHFVVHNVYLWAFVDLGIVGGFLVIGLLLGAVAHCVRSARGRPGVPSGAMVAAGLAAMIVFNLFIDGFYQRHFWVLVACAIGLPVYRTMRPVPQVRPVADPAHAAA
jgi:O-antigen ligase